MARPLRIEYPGALYHVTARGNVGQPIFVEDSDKDLFLTLLFSVSSRYDWRCFAFCLMDNHYHLVIETKKANLSRGMRQLNGNWAQLQNKKLKRAGHLFQGRFKAFLIEKDSYLLAVLRYVVLNPVRARICDHPKDYRYSSFLKTACLIDNNDPVDGAYVLSQFGADKKTTAGKYRRFVLEGINEKSVFDDTRAGIFLGSDKFVAEHTLDLRDEKLTEIPKLQRPDPKPPLSNLIKDRKDMAGIFKAHLEWDYSLSKIANYLGVHGSTISRAIRKHDNSSETQRCKT